MQKYIVKQWDEAVTRSPGSGPPFWLRRSTVEPFEHMERRSRWVLNVLNVLCSLPVDLRNVPKPRDAMSRPDRFLAFSKLSLYPGNALKAVALQIECTQS